MLQSSVSGLQRLFSSASSSLSPHTQRGQRQLESVTEEAHTYDLLYPDSDALLQGQHHAYPLKQGDPAVIAAAANSTDDRGGLDLQSPRDVRMIIAQDANLRSPQPRVLYDSHPSTSSTPSRNGLSPDQVQSARPRAESFSGGLTGGLTGGGGRRNTGRGQSNTAPHSRQSSLSQITGSMLTSPSLQLSPVNELGSLFGNPKSRNSTARPATSDGETAQGKYAREAREETEAVLECMFGAATGFPSTSSTKVHVRPPRSAEVTSENRPASATREPAPSTSFPKKRTPLTRSTTAADLQTASVMTSQQSLRQNNSAVWITRLFHVDLKEPNPPVADSTAQSSQDRGHSASDEVSSIISGAPSAKKEKVKQLKMPTFAIAILLQMPHHRQRPLTPSISKSSAQSPTSPKPWPAEGPSNFSIPATGSNSDIDYVIAQWNVIDRALSSLEVVARCKIGDAISRLEILNLRVPIREPLPSSRPGSKVEAKKPKQPTQLTLQLPASALQDSSFIHDFVNSLGRRIAFALKIRKVVAGQGRWGMWREEARWVDKWAGGREHYFFFFNLLTAFVGSHTGWLDSLAPKNYRHRHAKMPGKRRKEDNAIRHRTIIICSDKMASRRLVFLLSAFLPSAHPTTSIDGRSPFDANWSLPVHSHLSPSGISRERSLRRTISRKPVERSGHDKSTSHTRATSFSGQDSVPLEAPSSTTQAQDFGPRSRRASDARSVRSAALLISSDGSVTRKSSTTTTATIKPESSVPVAHFSAHPDDIAGGDSAKSSLGSSGSFAPVSLQRTLSRSESVDQGTGSTDSQPKSGWGSLVSYWSGRRGSSTSDSDPLASSQEGLGISTGPGNRRNQHPAQRLSQMVDEVTSIKTAKAEVAARESGPLQSAQGASSSFKGCSSPKKIPERPSPDQFPLKLSIDAKDGVVDVDLPPANSYPSSFGSGLSSSTGAHTAPSSLRDCASPSGRTQSAAGQSVSSESAGDVAGWLRTYHEDFVLQAVRPYTGLRKDIKRCMRSEPTTTQGIDETDADGWTTVCSAIIADTTKFSVTRMSLRRKNAASPHHRINALLESPDADRSGEEEIIEEPLMDMDPTFIDAVERVLSHSGDSSRVASRNQSRAPSPTRHHQQQHFTAESGGPAFEIPRSRCKSMVLGALEQVAKIVSAEVAAEDQGNSKAREGKRADMPAEGTLREGVRRWFQEVENQGRMG